jgi:hypothetical protein
VLQLSSVQGLSSLQLTNVVPAHEPAEHVSPDVQAFPSSQDAELSTFRHAPVAGSQLSVVQGFPSSQFRGVPLQLPPEQTSPVVQRSPSLQAFVLLSLTHLPPPMWTQESVVHGLASSQSSGVPAHTPPEQTSPVVQFVPSLQVAVLGSLTQPIVESHESLVQGLPSLQTTAVPVHAPLEQTSPVVQALPSLQVFVLSVKVHTIEPEPAQLSVVHGLLSSQTNPIPAQSPPEQTSPNVQSFPSSHAAVLSMKRQDPFAGLQLSSVHAFPSLQTTGVPAHVPPEQTSDVVHLLPSLQGSVLFT